MTLEAVVRYAGGLTAAALVGVLCGTLLALLAGAPVGLPIALAANGSPDRPVLVRGEVTGLAPQAPAVLVVQVSNPNPVAMVVQQVTAVAGDASADCPAGELPVARYDADLPGAPRYPLPGGGSAVVPVPVEVANLPARTHEACRDLTYPLTYTVTWAQR